jgi:signal transduction histidine kinase
VKGLTSPAEFTPTDLDEVVQGVCRVLHVVAEQHGVNLSVLPGGIPTALLDNRRIYNAVYNLVHNAIGATPQGGKITVTTAFIPGGGDDPHAYLEVQVSDTGCGMPPEIAAKLFGGNVRSTKPGGTGLGSRVVKNVIDAHSGQLIVDSTPDYGTRITARIPFRKG